MSEQRRHVRLQAHLWGHLDGMVEGLGTSEELLLRRAVATLVQLHGYPLAPDSPTSTDPGLPPFAAPARETAMPVITGEVSAHQPTLGQPALEQPARRPPPEPSPPRPDASPTRPESAPRRSEVAPPPGSPPPEASAPPSPKKKGAMQVVLLTPAPARVDAADDDHPTQISQAHAAKERLSEDTVASVAEELRSLIQESQTSRRGLSRSLAADAPAPAGEPEELEIHTGEYVDVESEERAAQMAQFIGDRAAEPPGKPAGPAASKIAATKAPPSEVMAQLEAAMLGRYEPKRAAAQEAATAAVERPGPATSQELTAAVDLPESAPSPEHTAGGEGASRTVGGEGASRTVGGEGASRTVDGDGASRTVGGLAEPGVSEEQTVAESAGSREHTVGLDEPARSGAETVGLDEAVVQGAESPTAALDPAHVPWLTDAEPPPPVEALRGRAAPPGLVPLVPPVAPAARAPAAAVAPGSPIAPAARPPAASPPGLARRTPAAPALSPPGLARRSPGAPAAPHAPPAPRAPSPPRPQAAPAASAPRRGAPAAPGSGVPAALEAPLPAPAGEPPREQVAAPSDADPARLAAAARIREVVAEVDAIALPREDRPIDLDADADGDGDGDGKG